MPVSKDLPWKRLAAEGAAVVVSILLAFAIDAWWAERMEHRAQRVELARLHGEFSEISRQLELESREEITAAGIALLQMSQEQVDRDEPLEVSDALLSDLTFYGNFDVATPVLDGIILSGRLERFESERVVTAIFEWRLAIKEVMENDNRLREIATAQLIPELTERGNVSTALLRKRSDPEKTIKLLVDDELEGHLALRIQMNRIFDQRLRSLRPIVDEVIAAVEHALEN